MSPQNQQCREIFQQAIEFRSESEQQDFIQKACDGDQTLLAAVQALLQAHQQAQSWLGSTRTEMKQGEGADAATGPNETRELVTQEKPGEIIDDRYQLLENIGEGGMGSVWVAKQTRPVKRKVAIKLIKAGMDSQQVLHRFEAERQALALMDHPNIAKILDGGMTQQGRPYFVMEYVKGIPFTKYCDDARLSLNERLKLFIPVCQAVQHAHHKGIVHRDLKPTNILVCLYDGQPVPKVIDFGLAKALHQSLTEHSVYTGHGMMVGTPLYMSPEQAEHNNLDVDTRTDIYSLGVLLYELLTGSTPLEKRQLKEAAYLEVLRLIRDVEPQRPSLRLSGSNSLPSVAAQRSINPKELQRSLSGELDWIVMKALEKERSRRYETATGLSVDIESFLAGDPITAHPPSSVYRFQKFVGKHRGLATAVLAIALLLTGGIFSTSWFALLANQRANESKTLVLEKSALAKKNEKIAANEKQLRLREAELSKEIQSQNAITTEQKCLSYIDMGTYLFDEGRQDDGCELICKAVTELPKDHRLQESFLNLLESRATRQGMWTKPTLDHAGSVYQAIYTEDDKFLITRGILGSDVSGPRIGCRVWEPATGKVMGDLTPFFDCKACVYDPSTKTVLLVLENGRIERWDYSKLRKVHAIVQFDLNFTYAKLSPDGETLALVCRDEEWTPSLVIVDIESKKGRRLNFTYPYFNGFAFTPDSKRILLGFDNEITAISTKNGERIKICKGKNANPEVAGLGGQYTQIECNQNSMLAGINSGFQLDVWNLKDNGKLIGAVSSKAQLTSVKFSPDGKTLALGADNGIVQLFDSTTLRRVGELVAFSPVSSIQFFPDGRWLAVQTADDLIRTFDLQLGREILHPIGHKHLFGYSISKSGRQVTTFSDQLTLARIWDLDSTLRGIRPFRQDIISKVVNQWDVAISIDREHYALTKNEDGQLNVKIKQSKDDALVADWKMATEELNFDILPFFSPSEQRLLFVIEDELVVVDYSQGIKVGRFLFPSTCQDLKFSPDGKRLLVGLKTGIGIVQLEELDNISVRSLERASSSGGLPSFSIDGRHFAFIDNDEMISIHQFDSSLTQQIGLPDRIDSSAIRSLAFHPTEEDTLVLALPRQLVKTNTHGPARGTVSTESFSWEIKDYSFSPNGQILAVAYVDDTIDVFDGVTFEKLNRRHVDAQIQSILFWPNSSTLVVNESGGGIVFDAHTLKRIGKLCEIEVLCFGSYVHLTPQHAVVHNAAGERIDISHESNASERRSLLLNAGGVPYLVSPDRFRPHIRVQESKNFNARFEQAGSDMFFSPDYEKKLSEKSPEDQREFHQNLAFRSRYRPNSERVITDGQLLTFAIGLKPDWYAANHHAELAIDNLGEHHGLAEILVQSKYHAGEYDAGYKLITSLLESRDYSNSKTSLLLGLQALNQRIWPMVSAPSKATDNAEIETFVVPLIQLVELAKAKTGGSNKISLETYAHTLGVAEYRLADYKAAIKWFEEIEGSSPHEITSVNYTAFLALSHLKLGNSEEAAKYRQLFDDAMKKKSNQTDGNLSFAKEVEEAFQQSSVE